MPKRDPKRSMQGRLVIVEGPRAGTMFPLVLKSTLVGRIDSAQLVIDDPTVSRLHARMTIEHDGVWIEDLDSREGTWVNGVAVRALRLSEGDQVAFGDFLLTFQVG